MSRKLANSQTAHPVSEDDMFVADHRVQHNVAIVYLLGRQQSGHQRLSQTRHIVDRIKLRLDALRLYYRKAQCILKNDLALLGDEVYGGREIACIDPGLEKF